MKNSICIAFVFLMLAGCASEQRTTRYYTIDSFAFTPQDTIKVDIEEPLPYIVEVVDFSIAGPYNDSRIALRTESNELEYYHYHQWAENPARSIRYYVWRVLHDANIFEVCQLRLTVSSPQFIVTGAVNKIERVDHGGESGAYVNGSLELVNVRENRVVLSHRFDSFSPFPDNAPMNVFAREVSAIFQNETSAFIEKINNRFNVE